MRKEKAGIWQAEGAADTNAWMHKSPVTSTVCLRSRVGGDKGKGMGLIHELGSGV